MSHVSTLFNDAVSSIAAENDDDRLAAVCRLMKEDATEVIEHLKTSSSSANDTVRVVVASVLGEMAYPSVEYKKDRYSLLAHYITADPSSRVVSAAITSLWRMPGISDEERLALTVPHTMSANDDVRLAIARSVRVGSGQEALSIQLHYTADSHPSVREWATFALGMCDDVNAWPKITSVLTSMLNDPSESVREEAIRGLVVISPDVGVPMLLKQLEEHGVSDILCNAVNELYATRENT